MLNKENIWSESSLPGQLCPITKFHGKPGCQRSQANGSCVAAGLITWGTWREGQGHSHSFGRIWRRFTPNLTSPRAKEHSRVLANQSSTCLSTPVFVLSCKAPPASRMKSMLFIRLLQAYSWPSPPCWGYLQSHLCFCLAGLSEISPAEDTAAVPGLSPCLGLPGAHFPTFPVSCHFI